MKKMLLTFLTISLFFNLSTEAQVCSKSSQKWESLSLSDQAELLSELEYLQGNELPRNTKLVSYVQKNKTFELNQIKNKAHKLYVEKAILRFDESVSREELEQTHFTLYGEEIFRGIDLLVSCDEKVILGGVIHKFQDGRNENGQEEDINWSAMVRFDQNAEILKNQSGQPFDDLSFSWTGH